MADRNLKLRVDVPPWAFVAIWCGVALFYGLCSLFLVAEAAVYFYIPLRAVSLMRSMEKMRVSVSGSYFADIGIVFVVLATIHCWQLTSIIFHSLRSRQFVFHSNGSIAFSLQRSLVRAKGIMGPLIPQRTSLVGRVTQTARHYIVWSWKAFGINSPSYGVTHVLRELIQTGVQTFQAYRLSALVARKWMNWIAVVLLVLNCWATPLIQCFARSSLSRSRLLSLVVNVTLDIVANFIFPTALFLPYYAQFEPLIENFSQLLWYTDSWYVQAVNEWQMLFITSLWDALSKFFVAFNISRSLASITRLIHRRSDTNPLQLSIIASEMSQARVVPVIFPNIGLPGHPTPEIHLQDWRARTERLGHRLLALWGIAVFALHIESQVRPESGQCVGTVRPWLSTRPVCSLMEISCLDGKHSGNASDFDHALTSIENEWLVFLVIRHCDSVEITPRIHELTRLIAFKIYNSTLVTWDADAALTQTHNPWILGVYLVSIKAQEIPPGLYHHDFPNSLFDIELCDWNVSSFPDAVLGVWPNEMSLLVEKFLFQEFPPVLAKLRPSAMSLACNNFTEIPAELWANPVLGFFGFTGNPLRELPSQRPASPHILSLSIMATQVSQLPSWVDKPFVTMLFAGSSPYCTSLLAGDADALNLTDTELSYKREYVTCTSIEDFPDVTVYPLRDEPILNPTRAH